MDVVATYPPIRVWGTVGAATGPPASGLETRPGSSTSPPPRRRAGAERVHPAAVPPKLDAAHSRSLADRLGLTSFTLFRDRNMAVFFIFAMLLGAALQLTNAYGDTFLHDFAKVDAYKGLFAVRYPAMIISISQISETLFILTIPFFPEALRDPRR